MNTFNNEIKAWADEHGLVLSDKYEAYAGYYEHDTLEGVYKVLVDFDSDEYDPMPGIMASKNFIEWELGQTPDSTYPFCINDVLDLINDNSDDEWKLDKLDTSDDWMTADVYLSEKNGKNVQLKIKYVNQETNVSANFPIVMEEFAAKYASLSIVCFGIDHFYRMFAFTHEAAVELKELINENCEPYPGSEDDDEGDDWAEE